MVGEQKTYIKRKISDHKWVDKWTTRKTYPLLPPGNLVSSHILYGFQNSRKQLFHPRSILGQIAKIF